MLPAVVGAASADVAIAVNSDTPADVVVYDAIAFVVVGIVIAEVTAALAAATTR